MESLRELYRIGKGPSSSHTMAPFRAARSFARQYPQAERFRAVLYGSLAKTGKGHLSDLAIKEAIAPAPVEIIFDQQRQDLPSANTLELFAYQGNKQLAAWQVISPGGGKIEVMGEEQDQPQTVYRFNTFEQIKEYCHAQGIRIWQYVEEEEGAEIWLFLHQIWAQMRQTIAAGLEAEGVLPGALHLQRKAKYLYQQKHIDESPQTRSNRLVCSYAFAVAEQSAAGGIVVTAPTCGASGVVPAVLHYSQQKKGFSDEQMIRALATGGIIGNLIKTNASISGAECGCQAEIGSACSMGSAALAELYNMDIDQIEYAAEIAMEHHLGLTCDPIYGLVQIPCIERNAVAAMRALDSLSLANFLTHTRKISFDLVVQTMYETGKDLFHAYKETSLGGLAKLYPLHEGSD